MTWSRLVLRHIVCVGPEVAPAGITFNTKTTAVIGLSNTGKSFIRDLLDFMLGGEELSRKLPEAETYDTVLLGLEMPGGKTVTLRRALGGGDAELLDGLVDIRDSGQKLETLALKARKNVRTISDFYLQATGMSDVVLRAKKDSAATQRLSIRMLAKVCLISETRIIEEISPLLSGQHIGATPERSFFKYLLSGVDDSALVSHAEIAKELEVKRDRVEAGRAFVAERRRQLDENGPTEAELLAQIAESEAGLVSLRETTGTADERLGSLRRRQRRLIELQDVAAQRIGEIDGLLSRFRLLQEHYASDLARLTAIREAASNLDSLAPGACPLCGAPAEAQRHDDVCEGDMSALANAAKAEATRIERLDRDLQDTIEKTVREKHQLEGRIAEGAEQQGELSEQLSKAEVAARAERTGYAQATDAWSALKQQLRSFEALREFDANIEVAQKEIEDGASELPDVSAPPRLADEFAKEVEGILQSWGVPGSERVFFDEKQADIQLSGKLRSAQGKGIRAVTYAAFVIGLMVYCIKNNRPHPGFVVLDSPLLSYKEAEPVGETDGDLRTTRVDEAFYGWLANDLPCGQVVIIENRDAPASVRTSILIHDFFGRQGGGRYGLFPVSIS